MGRWEYTSRSILIFAEASNAHLPSDIRHPVFR